MSWGRLPLSWNLPQDMNGRGRVTLSEEAEGRGQGCCRERGSELLELRFGVLNDPMAHVTVQLPNCAGARLPASFAAGVAAGWANACDDRRIAAVRDVVFIGLPEVFFRFVFLAGCASHDGFKPRYFDGHFLSGYGRWAAGFELGQTTLNFIHPDERDGQAKHRCQGKGQ